MALWRWGVILNLNVSFFCNTHYFLFRLLQLFEQALSRQSRILANRARPSQPQQYWRGRIHILDRRDGSNLQDDYLFYISSQLIISANTIGAVIAERNILTPLPLFVQTMPIQKAVTSGNGNIGVLQRKYTFKFKITLDRHNIRHNLNHCVLPHPAHFSLPSTFKDFLS